tara:strand:- start:446 stop:1081 length:636 start_codon:yes stop_codon:yes gene_type:complete
MSKIIVALDYNNPLDALEMAAQLRGLVDGFKINHMLWEQSEYLKDCGELFVDCKLWDTPNTIKQVLEKIIKKGATMVTVSTFNNSTVFDECEKYKNDIKILGVTYLTSWSSQEQFDLYNVNIEDMWYNNINRARRCLSGIICSPLDIKNINEPELLKVCPGIGSNKGQTRTVTPLEAQELGADYLIIGRTITNSDDPINTINDIRRSISND